MLTTDVRYFNYSATETLGDPAVYEAGGNGSGLGWNDQMSVAVGMQVDLTSKLVGRAGYVLASSLFDGQDTFFNLASDLGYQHVPSFGATYHLSETASISMGCAYIVEWSSTGPYVLPAGAIPGSSVTTELDTHIATLGINVRY